MGPLLFGLTLLCYLLGSIAHHTHLFAGHERSRRFATGFVAVGLLAHTAAIGVWCTTHGSILQSPTMPFSLVAYFIALAQLAVDFRRGWASVGALSVPLAFVAQFYASARTPGEVIAVSPGGALLRPHVMVLLLGFAAFTLAFCLAVLYLVQSRLLKRKQLRGGLFSRLPPLESITTGAHWLATIGFSMLTLGIITGMIAAPKTWGPQWYLDPRTLSSLVAWAIYAFYLGSSLVMGYRGRRSTYFLIAGFLVVLVALVASVARPRSGPHAVRRLLPMTPQLPRQYVMHFSRASFRAGPDAPGWCLRHHPGASEAARRS